MKRKFATLGYIAFVCFSLPCFAGDDASNLVTRYGQLAVNEAGMLTFHGKPVSPNITGNNGLSILNYFKISDSDVVLMRDDGGESCPAMYYFATVNPHGIAMSSRFGSCSDLAVVKRRDDSVFVTMPDYTGDEDSRAAVAKHICRYRYANGAVTQLPPVNGRLPCSGD
jgi:hypothetical protein